MKNKIAAALLVAVVATPVALPTAAVAQRWNGDRDGNWDPSTGYRDKNYGRRIDENERVYRGSDGRTYCKRANGTTGRVLGAGGGALLGKNLDQRHDDSQNRKNGYYCR